MNATKVKPIPDGMTAITPHLVCTDASVAIEFYKKAFNAVEEFRLPGQGGKLMHARIRIGGAAVFLVDEMPQWGALGPVMLKGSPVTIHHFVNDVDAAVAQAVGAGAKVTMPAADMFWGDRYAVLQDPFGHNWSLATHLRDMTADDVQKALAQMG